MMVWNCALMLLMSTLLLVHGEISSAQMDTPMADKSDIKNEIPLKPDSQQEIQDPLTQMKHTKTVLNHGGQENTMDIQGQKQDEQKTLNQPFQQTTNQYNQPYHNSFWTNPFSFINQNLFGNLGYQSAPPPPQVTGSLSETLLHHAMDSTPTSPVEGFNPPSPSSHQEIADAHRNWFEQQMKNMQDKVTNWFKH